jgi:hypothetical protein
MSRTRHLPPSRSPARLQQADGSPTYGPTDLVIARQSLAHPPSSDAATHGVVEPDIEEPTDDESRNTPGNDRQAVEGGNGHESENGSLHSGEGLAAVKVRTVRVKTAGTALTVLIPFSTPRPQEMESMTQARVV